MPEAVKRQKDSPKPSPRSQRAEQPEANVGESRGSGSQNEANSEGAFAQAANSFLEEQAKKLQMQPLTLAFRSPGI